MLRWVGKRHWVYMLSFIPVLKNYVHRGKKIHYIKSSTILVLKSLAIYLCLNYFRAIKLSLLVFKDMLPGAQRRSEDNLGVCFHLPSIRISGSLLCIPD